MSTIMSVAGPPARTLENEVVAAFKRAAAALQQNPKNSLPKVPRPVHFKHHGIVKAQFIVDGQTDDALRQGIFAAAKSYEAYVRFSNSGSNLHDGEEEDVRGAAIKVMGVEGKKLLEDEQFTQDFLLVDHPVFVARNPQEFMKFLDVRAKNKMKILSDAALNAEFPIFFPARRFVRNPLTIEYYSQTAYSLGPDAKVKYGLRPIVKDNDARLSPAAAKQMTPNYLRDAMVATLKNDDVVFEFGLQRYVNDDVTPVDDPTKEWGVITSPFEKVATLIIPRQTFDTDRQRDFGEQISFNPWHSLEAHRPLGRINELRLDAYLRMLAHRREPTGKETFQPYP